MEIREITADDAECFAELLQQLDSETSFLLFEPGERSVSPDEQRKRILSMHQNGRQTILIAEQDGQVVGHAAILGGLFQRNRYTASLVIGILQDFHSKGIGTALLGEADNWGRLRQFHRFELTVMAHNERAVRLYEKMGYAKEGVRKQALFVNGTFVDEFYMSKML